MRAASREVFCLHSPSRARHSLTSVGDIEKKANVQDFAKGSEDSATIFATSPTIFDLATHLVATLATVEDFPSVANSTMSLTMMMTTAPVFHG